MKVKLNIAPLQVVNGFEMQEIDSVFGVLTVRRYENKGEWLVFAPFWWERSREYDAEIKRKVDEGRELFIKYFDNLWD